MNNDITDEVLEAEFERRSAENSIAFATGLLILGGALAVLGFMGFLWLVADAVEGQAEVNEMMMMYE